MNAWRGNVRAAREQALNYYKSGLLTAEGAVIVTDTELMGAKAPGHILTIRWGKKSDGRIETFIVLEFPDLHLVEVVARHPEGDLDASKAVKALVSSLQCSGKGRRQIRTAPRKTARGGTNSRVNEELAISREPRL